MTQQRACLNDLKFNAYAAHPHAQVCRSPSNKAIHAADVGHHVHSFYEIVLVEKGSGCHLVHGTRVTAQPGVLTIFGPGSTHEPSGLEGCDFWVLIFNLSAAQVMSWRGAVYTERARKLACVDQLIHALHAHPQLSLSFQSSETPRHIGWLAQIEREGESRRVGAWDAVAAYLNLLLIDILRLHLEDAAAKTYQSHPSVAQALEFIDDNFRAPIELRDIARHTGNSPAYLTALVKRLTGQPVMAWLTERRLWEARSELLTSRKSLRAIADGLGYQDLRHFSQIFKKRFGASPLRWRKRIGA